jgi:hypothetical protein
MFDKITSLARGKLVGFVGIPGEKVIAFRGDNYLSFDAIEQTNRKGSCNRHSVRR